MFAADNLLANAKKIALHTWRDNTEHHAMVEYRQTQHVSSRRSAS